MTKERLVRFYRFTVAAEGQGAMGTIAHTMCKELREEVGTPRASADTAHVAS